MLARFRKLGLHFSSYLIVGLLAGFFMFATGGRAGDVYKIDQLSDFSATTPERFYRFEPNYYWIKPGDTVRFLNSLGNHTVKSVTGIWPKDAELIDIAHREQYDIVLTKPGVYGIKCKVHNRHGMYALIIVGDVKPDLDQWKNARLNDVGKRVMKKLFSRLEKDVKKRH